LAAREADGGQFPRSRVRAIPARDSVHVTPVAGRAVPLEVWISRRAALSPLRRAKRGPGPSRPAVLRVARLWGLPGREARRRVGAELERGAGFDCAMASRVLVGGGGAPGAAAPVQLGGAGVLKG